MGDFFGPIARRESRRNYSDRFAQSRPAFIAAEKPGPNPLARVGCAADDGVRPKKRKPAEQIARFIE